MALRSIPTTYRGVKFRSRLEADWAKAFDLARIEWLYEQDSYDLGSGILYLPDFWLPKFRTYVEVKGLLDDAAETKPRALARAAAINHILVVMAHAPAGQAWAVVDADGLRQWRSGFDRCETTGRAQFFDEGRNCRCCPRAPDRPWTPPYSREDWIQIARWWAWSCAKSGRMDLAGEFVEEAVRLQEEA